MTFSTFIGRPALVLTILLSPIGLYACGNKGPLYIPPPPVEQQSVPSAKPDSEGPISKEG